MVTTKKRACRLAICLLLALAGCGPPGPRALLNGEKLVKEHRYAEAVEDLKKAAELLPLNAQAWNHLGLAYHYNHQTAEAIHAYRKARELDRNLASACYNLGALEAEAGNYSAAVDDLTTYVSLEARSVPGYLRLASAETHLALQSGGAERTRLLEAARQGFEFVNLVHPSREEAAEALNGLGLIAIYRSKTRDAVYYFDAALQKLPDFGPALLNLAVIYHNRPADRGLAMAKYREYLAIKPPPANSAEVEATARQLEQDMRPPVSQPPPAPAPAPPPFHPAMTNAAPAPASNIVVAPLPATNRGWVSLPSTNRPWSFSPATNRASTPPPAVAFRAPEPKPAPPPKPVVAAISNPPNIEVVPLPSEFRQSQAIAPAKPPVFVNTAPQVAAQLPPPPAAAPDPVATPSLPETNSPVSRPASVAEDTPKSGIIAKLNPVHWFSKKNKSPPPPEVKTAAAANSSAATTPAPKPSFPRYHYLNPSKGSPGNRVEAAKLFAEGVSQHKNQRFLEATRLYEKAANLDPTYFEAYYNLGLASFEIDDMPASLTAYEHALALSPDFKDLRYNFALALLKANFPLDAVTEFERLAATFPDDARVHLALANIFAQKLEDPAQARGHYTKVLELEPGHPQAAAIRSWLADNPG